MVMVLKRELAFFGVILFFALTISLVALNMDDSNSMNLAILCLR